MLWNKSWKNPLKTLLENIRDLNDDCGLSCPLFDADIDFDCVTVTHLQKTYPVILLNDDYHTTNYVAIVLQEVFGLDSTAAWAVMWEAHTQGQSICQRGLVKTHAARKSEQLIGYGLGSIYELDE